MATQTCPTVCHVGTRFVALFSLTWTLYVFFRLFVLCVITLTTVNVSTLVDDKTSPSPPLNSNAYATVMEKIPMDKDATLIDSTNLDLTILSNKDAETETYDQQRPTLFGIDPAENNYTFSDILILAAFVFILYVPQMYGALQLYRSTDWLMPTSDSIMLALTHQKIQFVAVLVEILLATIAYSSLQVSTIPKYMTLLALILARLMAIFVVLRFIDEQSKKLISVTKRVKLNPSTESGKQLKHWHVEATGVIKATEKHGILQPNEIIIVTNTKPAPEK